MQLFIAVTGPEQVAAAAEWHKRALESGDMPRIVAHGVPVDAFGFCFELVGDGLALDMARASAHFPRHARHAALLAVVPASIAPPRKNLTGWMMAAGSRAMSGGDSGQAVSAVAVLPGELDSTADEALLKAAPDQALVVYRVSALERAWSAPVALMTYVPTELAPPPTGLASETSSYSKRPPTDLDKSKAPPKV